MKQVQYDTDVYTVCSHKYEKHDSATSVLTGECSFRLQPKGSCRRV